MRQIVLVGLFLFLTSKVFAQESVPKWEIGTDLLWLINKNSLPKYSILVRRSVGTNGAIRLRAGIDANSVVEESEKNFDNYNWLIRLGYERQVEMLPKKALFFYGADVQFKRHYSLYLGDVPPAQEENRFFKDIVKESGLVAFVGVRYMVLRNLSLSMESALTVSSMKIDRFRPPQRLENQYTKIQTLPLNTINLSFHF